MISSAVELFLFNNLLFKMAGITYPAVRSRRKVSAAAYRAARNTTIIFVLVQPTLSGVQRHKFSLGGRQAKLCHRKMRTHLLYPVATLNIAYHVYRIR